MVKDGFPMASSLRTVVLAGLVCGLPLLLGSCGEWHGAEDVNTDVGGGALGKGPGLFTGKEGGIVIYQHVWTGASPDGDTAE